MSTKYKFWKRENAKGLLIFGFFIAMQLFLDEFAPILCSFFLNLERYTTTFNISQVIFILQHITKQKKQNKKTWSSNT